MLIILPRLLYGFVIVGALVIIAMLWRPIRSGDRQAQLLALSAGAVIPAAAAFLLQGVEQPFAPSGALTGWPLTDWPVLFFVTVLSHLGLEEIRGRSRIRSRLLNWLSDRPLLLYAPAILTAPDFYARYLAGTGGLLETPAPYAASLMLVAGVLVISFSLGLWSRLRSRYRSARVHYHSIVALVTLCILLGLTLGWTAAGHPDSAFAQLVQTGAAPLVATAMFLIVLRVLDDSGLQPVDELQEKLRLPALTVTGAGILVAVGIGSVAGQLAAEPWDTLLAAVLPLLCITGLVVWMLQRSKIRMVRGSDEERSMQAAGPNQQRWPGGIPRSADGLARLVPLDELTSRQLQVVEKVMEGKTNAEIAEEMVITEGTVKKHLTRIYRKVDVGSRTELIALVMGTVPKNA